MAENIDFTTLKILCTENTSTCFDDGFDFNASNHDGVVDANINNQNHIQDSNFNNKRSFSLMSFFPLKNEEMLREMAAKERGFCLKMIISLNCARLDFEGKSSKRVFWGMASSSSDNDLSHCLQMYQAVVQGNLDYFKKRRHSLAAIINVNTDTALHVAVGTGMAYDIVEYLATELSEEQASVQNADGNTAVSIAAIVGNVKAVQILLEKHPKLNGAANHSGWIPVIEAARHGHKDVVTYLLDFIDDGHYLDPATYATGKLGAFFVKSLIISGFYDLALKHIGRYPQVATVEFCDAETFFTLVGRQSAFPSGSRLNFWQRFIYNCAPIRLDSKAANIINAKFTREHGSCLARVFQTMQPVQWKILKLLVPNTKEIQEIKLKHHQALQLVKQLCKEAVASLDHTRTSKILRPPLFLAAELGVHEVIEEIIVSFPHAVWFSDEENHNLFHFAVMNRREKVFNLMFQINNCKNVLLLSRDTSGNNILHLAGKLAPQHRLNLNSGAALQMQRELQWFKQAEKTVLPSYKEERNSEGKTPAMVFMEAHKELLKEGEKWMKATASSCSLVAALTAIMVFAAAITVPGGNNEDNGHPIFFEDVAFKIFGVADSISMFSSVAAILMFLSILSTWYVEDDFLYALPNRLICGLVTLFLSVTSMMVAFSAIVYLVFCDKKEWMLFPVGVLACLPISLFASLQFPLIVDIIYSTYGPGIFGRRSKQILY